MFDPPFLPLFSILGFYQPFLPKPAAWQCCPAAGWCLTHALRPLWRRPHVCALLLMDVPWVLPSTGSGRGELLNSRCHTPPVDPFLLHACHEPAGLAYPGFCTQAPSWPWNSLSSLLDLLGSTEMLTFVLCCPLLLSNNPMLQQTCLT